jgi:hypothetical protein
MRRRTVIGALLLIGVGVGLGTTVFRDDIAQATGLAQSVIVSNTPAQAVPVREQNLDGNQNLKVHEQGTANVNVTNSSLSVAPAAPITGGGDAVETVGGHFVTFRVPATATALLIHMTAAAGAVKLSYQGGTVGFFPGPAETGNDNIVLALTRPIAFDRLDCIGVLEGTCTVGWIGDQP